MTTTRSSAQRGFPEGRRIAAALLVSTKVWADQVAGTWGKGGADRFPDAARVAAAQASTLKPGTNAAQVTRTYLTLADRLDRTPAAIPGHRCRWTGRCCGT